MNSTWELRPALPEDSAGVVQTVKEVYAEYGFTWEEGGYHADLYDLRPYCDPAQAAFWVAEQGGEVVGCGGLSFHARIPGEVGKIVILDDYERIGGTESQIIRMYVRPSARRQGIARKIMEKIVENAPGEAVEIWSDKHFVDAHRLYQSFGAQTVGERICHDPDQAPEWGLVLRLPK